jgi:predicted Zn-dependent protease
MVKKFMLAPLLVLGLTTAITGQPDKLTETERALARLGDLTPDTVRQRLNDMRPPAYQPGPVLLNEIIKQLQLTVVSGERVERLKAALQGVLAYHERDGKLPIYVVRSEHPKAFVVMSAALFITTKLMVITNDAELRGFVAHELAHEYLGADRKQALESRDDNPLREIELFCDAVAALTLKELGDDPACYARALKRMIFIGSTAGSTTRSETETHPSLDVRLKLNQWLCQRLGRIKATP